MSDTLQFVVTRVKFNVSGTTQQMSDMLQLGVRFGDAKFRCKLTLANATTS